jgi:SpoVK/Ycf46/Vps4 family AAA+-type ATPase
MATAEQIKMLIKSHYDDEDECFATVALQMAAHEARAGHGALAQEIRVLVDKDKSKPFKVVSFRKEIDDLIMVSEPSSRLADLIVETSSLQRIDRVIREYRQRDKLLKHGLSNRRKLLLVGLPGTGKTMTAAVLANELRVPLYTVLMDRLMTKYMGETSAKLRLIFDIIKEQIGVFLFDEFDAIGTERTMENDVGEIRRILNAFLQFIEHDDSRSLIIAATNNPRLLDHALFRRFDDVLNYRLPDANDIEHLIGNILGRFGVAELPVGKVIPAAQGLSHAEISLACNDAIKESILDDKTNVSVSLVIGMLHERQLAHEGRGVAG